MSSPAQLSEHVMLSPDGKVIRIPKYMFDAFEEFITRRNTGNITVSFSQGSITAAKCVATKNFGNENGNGVH